MTLTTAILADIEATARAANNDPFKLLNADTMLALVAAARERDALAAEVAELRAMLAASPWRSVADDPPPYGVLVLCSTDFGYMLLLLQDDDDGDCWYTPEDGYFAGDPPTRWMPIPEDR